MRAHTVIVRMTPAELEAVLRRRLTAAKPARNGRSLVHRLGAQRVPRWLSVVALTALVGAQSLAVAAPAVASSPPLTITADMPGAVPAGHNWGFNDFFPRTLRVAQGATIQFAIEGFHTATLLPKGMPAVLDERASGLIKDDTDDGTRNVNGTTRAQFNIPAALPTSFTCGDAAHPCEFDGTSAVSSGVPFVPTGPFVVQIAPGTSPGAYEFHCRVHPGMRGTLEVVPENADVSTPAAVAQAVAAQVKADVRAGFGAEARASAAAAHSNPDGTTTWTMTAGTASPDGHTVILEMLPENLHIKSGDTVVWRPLAPNEPHTVTFPGELFSDLVPLCEGGGGDTPAIPNHFPPQGPTDFHCPAGTLEIETGGGNGVTTVSSPGTVSDSGIVAPRRLTHAYGVLPSAALADWTVHFTGAVGGVYHYVCQIHEGMEGDITVAP